MSMFEIGKKFYRIDCAVWNPTLEEYDCKIGKKEYESEKSARIALGRKKVTPDNIQYDMMEYEYDRYGLTTNERRLLIKDDSGTFDESGKYFD